MRCLVALIFSCLLPLSPVHAHKVIASVFSSGDVIEGEIGFSNGDMAPDVVVEVFDDAGNKLGETKTDADGFFAYKPTKRVPLVFKSNLGGGHVAEVSMGVDELPEIAGADSTTSATSETADAGDEGDAVASSPGKDTQSLTKEQMKMISQAVQKQVIPLRRDIDSYKEKNDLQSILGGIGYIFGLFGLGFYIAARRKMKGT